MVFWQNIWFRYSCIFCPGILCISSGGRPETFFIEFLGFIKIFEIIITMCVFLLDAKKSIDFVKCTLFFNPKSMWSILQMLALKNFTMELPKSVFGADFYFKPFSKRKISKVYYVRRRHSCDKDSAPYQRIEVWQQLCLHLR